MRAARHRGPFLNKRWTGTRWTGDTGVPGTVTLTWPSVAMFATEITEFAALKSTLPVAIPPCCHCTPW